MLCGELLNGGFVSAGAVPAVPYSLLGLWIPGCVRTTSPRLVTSPYLTLLTELLAAGCLEEDCQGSTYSVDPNMDLVRQTQQSNTNSNLDLDLDNDDSVFLVTRVLENINKVFSARNQRHMLGKM
ncbi:hypothetical protein KQX54_019562 [Cotesia glomerata]|uniref:Uncharacterized protein n=1 Tax=Cotesia glomerata TaxID=32391 RepID=A0AAV7IDU1_COTGL|nr:hypothetical protein KQX54_019562 [Cotesia glomerata]